MVSPTRIRNWCLLACLTTLVIYLILTKYKLAVLADLAQQRPELQPDFEEWNYDLGPPANFFRGRALPADIKPSSEEHFTDYLFPVTNTYVPPPSAPTKTTVNFDGFDNEKGAPDGRYIVPNIVHFLRFGQAELTFVDAVCVLAALKHQKPDKIYFHTDVQLTGKYWNVLMETPGFKEVLVLKNVTLPTEIFGQKLSKGWRKFHGGDITRMKILMEYGGIFLDNDSYIVRSLDDLRKFEMSLGWMEDSGMANQVIIAHKDARFLKLWLLSYKDGYNASQWYYNAGIKPTKEILEKKPYLIHREKLLLANHHITNKMFQTLWPEWRTHYALHLLIRHQYLLKSINSEAVYPVKFNETNILKYPCAFRDMVLDVYPIQETDPSRQTTPKSNDPPTILVNMITEIVMDV